MLYNMGYLLSVSLPSVERVLQFFVGRERGGTRRVVQEHFLSRQDLLSWIRDSSMSPSKSLVSELPRDRVPAKIWAN